jgi:hypothetical protein
MPFRFQFSEIPCWHTICAGSHNVCWRRKGTSIKTITNFIEYSGMRDIFSSWLIVSCFGLCSEYFGRIIIKLDQLNPMRQLLFVIDHASWSDSQFLTTHYFRRVWSTDCLALMETLVHGVMSTSGMYWEWSEQSLSLSSLSCMVTCENRVRIWISSALLDQVIPLSHWIPVV